jgi:hypothetical protein
MRIHSPFRVFPNFPLPLSFSDNQGPFVPFVVTGPFVVIFGNHPLHFTFSNRGLAPCHCAAALSLPPISRAFLDQHILFTAAYPVS